MRRNSSVEVASTARVVAAVGAAVLVVLLASCSGTGSSSATRSSGPGASTLDTAADGRRISFVDVDDAYRRRVADDDLAGAVDITVRDGTVLHQQGYGSYTEDTVMSIASASKWLTSAVIMSLVDEQQLDLDASIATYLPAWQGDKAAVTLRQLLAHHAGLSGSSSCLGNPQLTLRACADELADTKLAYPPGTEFHYGNAGYTVAAAAAEAVTGQDFATLLRDRVTGPLGMTDTWFPRSRRDASAGAAGAGAPRDPNPNPITAAGAVSTAHDYLRFVAMMARGGTTESGNRVLSERAVREIEADQVVGLDTSEDSAVQITDIPTYGLGVWRDRVGSDDVAQQISGSGSVGFYPWIDLERRAYGVIAIDDEGNSAEHNVPASARILHTLILPAIDNTPR